MPHIVAHPLPIQAEQNRTSPHEMSIALSPGPVGLIPCKEFGKAITTFYQLLRAIQKEEEPKTLRTLDWFVSKAGVSPNGELSITVVGRTPAPKKAVR